MVDWIEHQKICIENRIIITEGKLFVNNCEEDLIGSIPLYMRHNICCICRTARDTGNIDKAARFNMNMSLGQSIASGKSSIRNSNKAVFNINWKTQTKGH